MFPLNQSQRFNRQIAAICNTVELFPIDQSTRESECVSALFVFLIHTFFFFHFKSSAELMITTTDPAL